MLDTVVISGDDVCCSVVLGTLVVVFRVMWSELLMTSAFSCTLWSCVQNCIRFDILHYLTIDTKHFFSGKLLSDTDCPNLLEKYST